MNSRRQLGKAPGLVDVRMDRRLKSALKSTLVPERIRDRIRDCTLDLAARPLREHLSRHRKTGGMPPDEVLHFRRSTILGSELRVEYFIRLNAKPKGAFVLHIVEILVRAEEQDAWESIVTRRR